jgi:hypothetical protein
MLLTIIEPNYREAIRRYHGQSHSGQPIHQGFPLLQICRVKALRKPVVSYCSEIDRIVATLR